MKIEDSWLISPAILYLLSSILKFTLSSCHGWEHAIILLRRFASGGDHEYLPNLLEIVQRSV